MRWPWWPVCLACLSGRMFAGVSGQSDIESYLSASSAMPSSCVQSTAKGVVEDLIVPRGGSVLRGDVVVMIRVDGQDNQDLEIVADVDGLLLEFQVRLDDHVETGGCLFVLQPAVHLPTLTAGQGEVPVVVATGGVFQGWFARGYDFLEEGDSVAEVLDVEDQTIIGAPTYGTVIARQTLIRPGNFIRKGETIALMAHTRERIDGPRMARKGKLNPLLDGQMPVTIETQSVVTFHSFLVGYEKVSKGDVLVKFYDDDKTPLYVKADTDGYMVDQMQLHKGDVVTEDTVVATLVPALSPQKHETSAKARGGGVFQGWLTEAGKEINQGDGLADFDEGVDVCDRSGTVLSLLKLKTGDVVQPGTELAIIGKPMLEIANGQVPIRMPWPGGTFTKWVVSLGATIAAGDPIGKFEASEEQMQGRALESSWSAGSESQLIAAPVTGMLARVDSLHAGAFILPGRIIGAMAPQLEADSKRSQSLAEDAKFQRWTVSVGDYVSKGDTLALFEGTGDGAYDSGETFWAKSKMESYVEHLLALQRDDYVGQHVAIVAFDVEQPKTSFVVADLIQKLRFLLRPFGNAFSHVFHWLESSLTNFPLILYSLSTLTVAVLLALLVLCCCWRLCCKKRRGGTYHRILPARHEALQPKSEVSAVLPYSRASPAPPLTYFGIGSDSASMSTTGSIASPGVRRPVPDGIRVDFEVRGGEITSKFFNYRPLGLVLTERPVTVSRFVFNSYAQFEGVEPGWVVRRVGSRDITSSSTAATVQRMLDDCLRLHPCWPLRVDFLTSHGDVETRYFEKQPLGLIFSRKAPIVIEQFKPLSYGRSVGVEVDWTIVRIGDVDVTDDHNFRNVDGLLMDGLSRLDTIPDA